MKKFLHTIVLFSSFGMPFAALSSENFNLPSDLPSDLPENIRKNIGNSRYRALRYLACQILSENSKGVIDLFNAKTPTQQLMKEAKESLENESYSQEVSERLRKSKKELVEELSGKSRFISEVNLKDYKSANPDPLDKIPEDGTVEINEKNKLGEGAHGSVYLSRDEKFVVKVSGYFLDPQSNEKKIGNILRNTGKNVNNDTQIAYVQGYDIMVPVKSFEEDKLIMERINGNNLAKSIENKLSPFSNGYVDDPQKAIRQTCSFISGLLFLEKANIEYIDLKPHAPENIMVEERGNEYSYRLIDFGIAQPRHSADNSDDTDFVKLLPLFLFGKEGKKIQLLPSHKSLISMNFKNSQKIWPIEFLKKFRGEMQEKYANPENHLGSKLVFYKTLITELEMKIGKIRTETARGEDEKEEEKDEEIRGIYNSITKIWTEKISPLKGTLMKQWWENEQNNLWEEWRKIPDEQQKIQNEQSAYENQIFQEWLSQNPGKSSKLQELQNEQNALWTMFGREWSEIPEEQQKIQNAQNAYANQIFQEWLSQNPGKSSKLQELQNEQNALWTMLWEEWRKIPEEQQKIQNAQNAYANQIFQKWLPFRFERWIENYQESYEENIEKEELKEAMRQYIFKQYKRANDSMRTATKKLSYPEPVLEKIVDIALKFLNKDLPRDEVLFEFQNLAFSNWKKIKNENGEETYDTLNTYKIEGAPDWNLPAKK